MNDRCALCGEKAKLCSFCFRDCMKMGEVDGKKIGCTVSLLVCIIIFLALFDYS